MLTFEEFQKTELIVGKILSVQNHPNADKLLVLQVDLGEDTPRNLVAGIKGHYRPEQLEGMLVVVVANLQPVKLRGVESRGMLLAAQDAGGVTLITPQQPVSPGSRVL